MTSGLIVYLRKLYYIGNKSVGLNYFFIFSMYVGPEVWTFSHKTSVCNSIFLPRGSCLCCVPYGWNFLISCKQHVNCFFRSCNQPFGSISYSIQVHFFQYVKLYQFTNAKNMLFMKHRYGMPKIMNPCDTASAVFCICSTVFIAFLQTSKNIGYTIYRCMMVSQKT